MLELLNTKIFDNERNILNADLFVNNLKHTFKAFKFNTKITYEVYRNITIYHITWNDDKSYEDMLELKKEIALALGVTTNEFEIEKEKENEVKIKVQNMKKSTLSLKELLEESKDKDNNNIPLGLSEEDKVIYFNIEKDKNLLVTGVTGIGKTNLFNNIILNILMNKDKTKIIILDSQSINYNTYDKLCEVVNNEQEIINKIKEIREYTTSGSGPTNLLKQGEIAIAMGMTAQGVEAINAGYDFSIVELETGSPYNTTSCGIIK